MSVTSAVPPVDGDRPGSPDEPLPPPRAARAATVVLWAGLALLAGVAVRAQRGLWFAADEWDVLAHYVDGNLTAPYNGHLSAVPVAIYQFLARTVGIDSYTPYGVLGIVVFLALPVAFFMTHRRVVDARVLAVAALGIAWSWGAQTNLLYGFLVNFDIPLVLLVLAWWLLRRDTFAADLWASLALAVALASSSVGVVVACAVGVELVARRVPLRRLARFAPPVLAWLGWWVFRHGPTTPASLGDRARYAWEMTVAILAGFTAGWKPGAAFVAVALAAFGWVAHRRWRSVDEHVVGIVAALGAFVVLTAFSRAGELALNPTDSPRYVFLGQFLVIAAVVWCLRGRSLPSPVPLAAAALVLLGALPLVGHIDDYRSYVLDYQQRARPFLAGAEAAGQRADQRRILPLNLIPVTVGQYLRLVEKVGSPVLDLPLAELGGADSRREVDVLLADEVALTLGQAPPNAACAAAARPVPGGGLELEPEVAYLVTTPGSGPVRVRLRRFADPGHGAPLTGPENADRVVLSVPADGATRPWILEPDGNPTVCRSAD